VLSSSLVSWRVCSLLKLSFDFFADVVVDVLLRAGGQ